MSSLSANAEAEGVRRRAANPAPSDATTPGRPGLFALPLDARSKAVGAALGLAAAAAVFAARPFAATTALFAFAAAVLALIAVCDIEHRIVPNRVVLPATAAVLLAQAALAPSHVLTYVLAALAAGAFLAAPRLITGAAVGMGDVKLAFLIGVTLGWGVGGAVALAFFAMFPFALVTVLRGGASARKATLPFAPFLAAGTLVLLLGAGLPAH